MSTTQSETERQYEIADVLPAEYGKAEPCVSKVSSSVQIIRFCKLATGRMTYHAQKSAFEKRAWATA